MRHSFVCLSIAAAVAVACGPSKEANGPRQGDPTALARMTAHALEVEATRPATEAFDAWTKVLEEARETRGTPLAREAALAAIDALSGHEVVGLESLGDDLGVAARVVDGEKKAAAVLDATLASDGAKDPYVHVAAATARMQMSARRGDVAGLAKAMQASGCATEATIVGPFVGPALGPLQSPGPVDGGAIAANYPPPATSANVALALGTKATKSDGRGCTLDITGTSVGSGLRYAVIDVEVPTAQWVALGFESTLPIQFLVDGKPIVGAAYGEIATSLTRFGRVWVNEGTMRVVAKIGAYEPSPVVVYALGEDGAPLASKAAPVSAAPAPIAQKAKQEEWIAGPDSIEARVTKALGQLAAGNAKLAEATVAEIAHPAVGLTPNAPKPPPAVALVWARTLMFARDLPDFRRLERFRAAFEATLEGWPTSWEAIIGYSRIVALQRRGGAGDVEAIAEAKKRRDGKVAGTSGGAVDPMVDAYLAIAGDDVYGVQEEALGRVKPVLAGTRVGWKLLRATAKETDDQRVKAECDPVRPDMGRLECAYAKSNVGDRKGVLGEIQRLRALYAEPRLATSLEIETTLKESGVAAARALYEKADVGDRSTRIAVEVMPPGKEGVSWLRHELRILDGDARTISDVLGARRAAGDASAGGDLALSYDGRTRAAVAADKAKAAMPDAGTLILDREERYSLDPDGYLHAIIWDVRRLAGTGDVDANASARVASTSTGHGYITQTVHRVFKSNGTIVEPDRVMAAQGGAELAQIEPGDYVELVAEGWFLPRTDGSFDLDTADLLPARTAVARATISLDTPTSIPLDVWSHPELGKPAVADAGGVTKRVWTLTNHDVRRGEKSQAALDASVAVRVGSWTWKKLGEDALEGLLAEEERDPEVAAWIAQAVGADKSPTIDLLARLEKASKRSLPRIGFLPLGGGAWGMQSYTARTVLLDAQGSRVALVRRALQRLGIKNDVVWAEQQPYSADPKMVARPWRFTHALLVAWVAEKAGGETKPVWMDLDVEGYPPPPGRTSSELRGRVAITTAGEIVPVPPNAAEDPDTVTIDLTVDETGKAKGTVALLLRGRDAQDVAGVLEEEAGAEREMILREFVLAWAPGCDVLDVTASAETWQVLLTAHVEVPILLVPDGKRFAVAGSPPLHGGGRAATLGQTYAAQAKRKTALSIREAVQYTIHRVIRLPAGTAIATPLPGVDLDDTSASMKATRKAKVDGTTLVEDIAFSLPTGVVAPEKFDAFTAAARTIDDAFGAVVLVSPPQKMAEAIDAAIANGKATEKKTEKKPAPAPKK